MVKRIVLKIPELLSAKNLIAVVLLSMMVFIIGLLAFALFTPSSIELSATSDEVVANGVTPLSLSVSVKSLFGTNLPGAKVVLSSDKGYLSSTDCKTDSRGICSVNFIPVKSLSEQRAMVVASIGGVSDNLVLTMTADEAESITLESADPFLLADGYSSTTVTATLFDDAGNFVPDGSRVSFSVQPPEMGSFSRGGVCNTINGVCTLTFTSSVNPGNATLVAVSGDVSGSARISLLTLLPEAIEVQLSSISVPADGENTVIVTVRAKDELGMPVQGTDVTVDASLGTLDKEICTTDSSGECSFTYAVGEVTGTDEIAASIVGYELSASRSLILLPVSNLEVNMMAYENVGNPIIPAFVRSYEFHGQDMARIIITNEGNSEFEGVVSLVIPEWSEQGNMQITVAPDETAEIYMTLTLKKEAYENLNAEPVYYLLSVTDDEGEEVFRNNYYTTLAPYNTMVWGGIWNNMIAAWDTPNAPAIHELVTEAADNTPWSSMTGYQEIEGYSHEEITYHHMKAIYDTLDERGMVYVNAPYALAGMQTVYTPTQSLDVNGANCIDGTMVFASALTSMGMDPLVVLTENHAFICVRSWYNSDYIQCVETTMIGEADFEDAVDYAGEQFDEHSLDPGFYAINVNSAIENGVNPLPS